MTIVIVDNSCCDLLLLLNLLIWLIIIIVSHYKEVNKDSDRQFRVVHYNLFGNPVINTFDLREIDKRTTNPFASFRVKDSEFYVFGDIVQDESLRNIFSKQ